jgi:hypothetical protein
VCAGEYTTQRSALSRGIKAGARVTCEWDAVNEKNAGLSPFEKLKARLHFNPRCQSQNPSRPQRVSYCSPAHLDLDSSRAFPAHVEEKEPASIPSGYEPGRPSGAPWCGSRQPLDPCKRRAYGPCMATLLDSLAGGASSVASMRKLTMPTQLAGDAAQCEGAALLFRATSSAGTFCCAKRSMSGSASSLKGQDPWMQRSELIQPQLASR